MFTQRGEVCNGVSFIAFHYRPHSEASECYVFTGMCHFNSRGGGWACHRSQHLPPFPWDQVTTPPPPPGSGHNTPSPQDQATTPPPLGPGHNTPPPPGSGHNTPSPQDQATTPPPWDQVTTFPQDQATTPPPAPRDQVTTPSPPGPGHNTFLPPLGPGHNTSPQDQVTTPPQDQVTTPPSPQDYGQVGGMHPTGMHSCFTVILLFHVNA